MTNKTPVDNIIELRNVYKEYDGKQVVKNASLTIKRGEFVTLLGPSGCGKTTTLRMIAGFEMPTSGKIIFNGKDITDTPPHLRPVNTVFQKYALFPHLNVFNNIAFGLKLKVIPNGTKTNKKGETVQLFRKYTKAEIKEKVNNALKMVDLEDYGHRAVKCSCAKFFNKVIKGEVRHLLSVVHFTIKVFNGNISWFHIQSESEGRGSSVFVVVAFRIFNAHLECTRFTF